MWLVINGFDYSLRLNPDSVRIHAAINDPQPTAEFTLDDPGCQLSFQVGQEVIIFDENAPPTYTYSGRPIPQTPAHQLQISSNYAAAGTLASTLTISQDLLGTPGIKATLNNAAVGTGYAQQTTLYGYIHPGQSYCLSCYLQALSSVTGAVGFLQINWLDLNRNLLSGSISQSWIPPSTATRYAISGQAPAGAAFIQFQIGVQTTSSTNSGIFQWTSPQLEPMWFVAEGVTYPTPDLNNAQVSAARMPDGTFSRNCRLFAGIIHDIQVTYDGPNRLWHLSCIGPGAVLENGIANASFSSQYDDQIISSLVSSFFSSSISIQPANYFAPNPIQRGVLVDSISYADNSFREILNSLVDQSGYTYYLDWYYTLHYQPSFYNAAPFVLTDTQNPDLVTQFPYEEYQLEIDGTQIKNRVKVVGGKYAVEVTDTFSGNGSATTFALTYPPQTVRVVSVGGSNQKFFFAGTGPTLGQGGYTAQIDKSKQQVIFASAPASGTNNVVVTYLTETNVVVQVASADSFGQYQRWYDSKINDSSLTSTTSATIRGLQELSRYALARSIRKLKTTNAPVIWPGTVVYFTHTLEGTINQPQIVQEVELTREGGASICAYTLGAWNPNFVDHLRLHNKALNRATATANVNIPQQYDAAMSEIIAYSESATFTAGGTGPYTYGSARYGFASYS